MRVTGLFLLQILFIRIDIVGLLDFMKFRIVDALEGLGILHKMLIVQSKQKIKLANNREGLFHCPETFTL